MRYSRRRNNVAIAALMLCLAFAAGMIVFALRQMPDIGTEQAREAADNAAPAEQRYAGTIVIPGRGACRRMEFDNATGELRPAAPGSCDDGGPVMNSTQGRIDAIRGAFQKH
jgi:hypothetical protein